MPIRSSAQRAVSTAFQLRTLARRERDGLRDVPLPLPTRLRHWRQGFLSDTAVTYDLAGDRRELYVTDAEWALVTPWINGIRNPTLNDKLLFFHTMRSLDARTPTVHGLVERDRLTWIDTPRAPGLDGLLELLREAGELVVKPHDGGKGDGVRFLAATGALLTIDGAPATEADLAALLRPGTLICERVRQAAYADAVYAGAVNTIRVMTMWDLERGEPFVAAAAHRFATSLSAPADNISRGGIWAGVDPESGVLGAACTCPPFAEFAWHAAHPETGAPIAGTQVPGWVGVREELLRVAERLARVPYVGWDVLVGPDGPTIIEGNNWPDTAIQVFGPLLADPRVRRFYAHHGLTRAARVGGAPAPAPRTAPAQHPVPSGSTREA